MASYRSFRLGPLLQEFRAAFVKDLKTYFRYPAWIAGEFITTPLWFLFFALGVVLFTPTTAGPTSPVAPTGIFDYFFWGFTVVILFSTSLWGIGQSIRTEQLAGTLEQMLLAPVNRISIISGRWARTLLTDTVIILYTAALVTLGTGATITLANPFLLVVTVILFETAIVGFGLMFAAATFRIKAYNTLANFIQFAFLIFAGVFYPPTLLPAPLSTLSLALPFTYYVDAIKHAAVGVEPLMNFGVELSLLVLLSVGFLAGGIYVFDRVERSARARGSIATS